MRTFIKLIIAIIIIAIAALAALPFIIDPNDYKDEIAAQVEKATGRKLTLQGDIGLSVFPWIALELGQLSLSNASGFKAESFASVEAAEIRIKLMPLLKKQLEMDTIVLDGLLLNLETNEEGVTNWDDLTKAKDPADADVSTTPESSSTEPTSGGLSAINIAGVKLSNANVLWSDASKDENFQLRNLNLDTDPLIPGEPTALTTSFDLISSKPEAKAHVKLDTKIIVDLEKQIYALESLKLNTVANSSAMPLQQANLNLEADINANMASELVTINNLVMDLQATGTEQKIDAKLSGLIESNLATQQHRINNLVITADLENENLPGGKAKLDVNTNIVANLADETFQANDLAIKLADLTMNGRLQGEKILSDDLAFNGNVQIKPFNLRKLANDLKIELPEMADPSTLELVQLSTELSGTKNSITAKDLQLTLDQSQLAGQFGISNFEKPSYTFTLTLDQIDADRYLPPVKEDEDNTAKEVATPATTTAAGSNELPLATLRDINAKGSMKIGKLKASGISTENIVITIDAKDGLIKLSPLSADLYQGKYQGNVNIDARGDNLKLAVDENLQGVQAGPLLKDLTGNDRIAGTANANVKLNGSGKDIDAIKHSLNGNGSFSFTDGALKGINIAEAIRQAKAVLSGQRAAETNEPVQTDFSSLKGSFTANEGIVNNQDLELMSPLLRVTGAGDIDIPREVIDYAVRVSIVGTAEGQGGKTLEDLKGLTIPVKITGSFDNPRPKVDLAAVLKEQATDEVKAKAEEKLKEKLGDGLGGLLGSKLGIESKSESSAEATDEPVTEEQTSEDTPEEETSPSAEDMLKEKLKGLF